MDRLKKIDPIVFENIALIEVPVQIGDAKYTLREINGSGARQYQNEILENTELEDGKVVRIRNMAGLDALLASLTLFDDKDQLVPISLILTWPPRVISTIAERSREISELDATEKDEEGNLKENPTLPGEQSPTTDG